jgi:CHAD domain-containing protein
MNPTRLSDRLVARALRALGDALPAAIEGDAAGVHTARVATRRIREALPVVLADAPARKTRKLRRAFREVTRALGPVREVDVALALADAIRASHPGFSDALAQVREDLEGARAERRERMLGMLERIDLERAVERVGHALPGREGRSGHAAATVLTARVARRGRALRQAVEAAGTLYASEPVHAVRIAVKKLRYALELATVLKLLPTKAPVTRLKATQETLGHLHDREVFIDWVRRVHARVPAGQRHATDGLAGLVDLLEAECRTLHAAYVAGRQRLTGVAEAALEALVSAPSGDEDSGAAATVH